MKQSNMLRCTITSPEKTTVYKNIASITLPGISGEIQIWPGHAETFILLQAGNVTLRQATTKEERIQITSGECHVKNDTIRVIL